MSALVNNSEAIVNAYVAIWDHHDLDASEKMLDPNIILYSPLYPNGVKGLTAHHEADVKFFKSMPDFQFHIQRIAAKDNFVAAELTGTGTSTGPAELPGRPPLQPTGRRVEFQLGSFFRVNSKGLIEEEKYVYDRIVFLQQIGVGLGGSHC
ncbi:MAG: ester cyclase [Nitrososphaerales archaeon]